MGQNYTKEELSKYPYFAELLEKTEVDALLDPLTGIVSRRYIIGFAKRLIRDGIPFTFAMLDLDNFKFINDTYGHAAGDVVLMDIGERIADFTKAVGVCGRFGGDELLMINLRDTEYDDKKSFFVKMYESHDVLRRNVVMDGCSPFVTGTSGCASYPFDAKDYEGLFALMDKALYRGKTKGRNCYIIYVEAKHKNIEIRHLAKAGIYSTMQSIVRHVELVPGFENKLHSVMPLLMDTMQITELYYTGKSGVMKAVLDSTYRGDASDIAKLMNDDLHYANNLDRIEANCPCFYKTLKERGIEAVMVTRVGMDEETDGYLICAEPHSLRIWQDEECAAVYFLAKLLAAHIRIGGEKMD
ncbi:MAG: GGDEF domain-containing protein [Lachnospiraceae bacterium]|nr:GGDEF domain-containing protein [Lachnospiraceae bacterium]